MGNPGALPPSPGARTVIELTSIKLPPHLTVKQLGIIPPRLSPRLSPPVNPPSPNNYILPSSETERGRSPWIGLKNEIWGFLILRFRKNIAICQYFQSLMCRNGLSQGRNRNPLVMDAWMGVAMEDQNTWSFDETTHNGA